MKNKRIASIDILRGLTMFLMIWVNDFFTLTDIPKWLKHANASEDYLGFSDIIFPLFLFILGLSIPYAIQQRKANGSSTIKIASHIITRSISLIIIGVFIVNWESAHHGNILIGRDFWCLLMVIGVVLIWMNWSKSPVPKKWHKILQATGILILVFLAAIYRGGPDGDVWMTSQWWGILGLIGWAYFANAIIYLFSKGKLSVMVGFLLFFNALSILHHAGLLPDLPQFLNYFSVIYTGSLPALTTAGIVAALLLQKLSAKHSKKIVVVMVLMGILNIVYGFLMRPYWGISKSLATPAWVGICTGIGFILFALFYVIADVYKQTSWAKIIAPAGTATLTCYMIPYFVYPLRSISTFRLPDFLNEGFVGLFGSLIFALLVVMFTGLAEKRGFKLKL
jgi:predicted acyltransferase